MFDGFTLTRREGDGVRLRVRHGGSGPAALLLHGHPRTHSTWHRVAPLPAAAGHTVVCPDLRGYGESEKPPTDPSHSPYSERAMTGDCLAVMRGLGHERFTVVGHDRGAYVATRLALDHPEAVSAVSVLDAVPVGEALWRCDATFAASWWHISFRSTVHAERLRFAAQPRTAVRFPGTGERESTSHSDRTRLPDRVAPGEEYRDVTVSYRLATRLTGPEDAVPEDEGSGSRSVGLP